MKIKRLECVQFAGVHDIDIDFTDGLNLIIGENESGKSTLTDLIFRILFKDTKIDGRSDAEFIDWYFPKKVRGPQGDVIDGTLVFDTEKGSYKLSREWEKRNGTSRLTTPERTMIKNSDEIARVLSEELGYREGVFGEIVFASQKRKQNAIESIMKALPRKKNELTDTREDLTSILTQAALETGGVSLEKLERRLQEKLISYDSHWNCEEDCPEGGKRRDIGNKWIKNVGAILAAYYAMEEIRQAQKDTENAEKKVEMCQNKLAEIQKTRNMLEDQLKEFWKYKGLILSAATLRKNIDRDNRDLSIMEFDLKYWPEKEEKWEKAKELKKQQDFVQIKKRYLTVKDAHDEYVTKKLKKNGLREVKKADIVKLEDLIRQKQLAESKLSGLNLTARINQLGEIPIKVKNISSGEPTNLFKGEYRITEAVEISIPNVMEMQLVPQGVDVDLIRDEIIYEKEEIQNGFEYYGVSSIEDLLKLYEEYENASREYDQASEKLRIILNGESWETIKINYEKIDIVLLSEEELARKIKRLCGSKSIEDYLGRIENSLELLNESYGSKESLSKSIYEIKMRIFEDEKDLKNLDDIPEKFLQIKEPKQFEENLTKQISYTNDSIKLWNDRYTYALKGLGERTSEEYTEELLEKESSFIERKTEYAHWKNIANIFFCLKEQLGGNPMRDIEVKFREYLDIISDGSIELQSIDEKMSVQLASGNNKLAYDILSNGTKDTISLAFRLAMLEHLYPKGEGLAVFDDSFTEMDPRRVQQSCKLIEKFAENNQVIFITCDDKYSHLMKVQNVIRIKR